MKNTRKYFFILFFLFLLLGFSNFVFAQKKIEINFFYSPTCPHCAAEKPFLEELKQKYPEVEIKEFSLSNKENTDLLTKFYKNYKVPSNIYGFVPMTFIGEKYFLGFNDDIEKEIEDYVLNLSQNKNLLKEESQENNKLNEKIKVPFLGEINPYNFSLPLLAVILGFFDGFNVCSLGALVLILGLVFGLNGNRKRVLILGGTYLLVTSLVYGALIFLWHQVFSYLSLYLREMEIVVGILAMLGGVYFFREFLKARENKTVCSFGGISEKFSKKLQNIFKERNGILILILSVLVFAAIVTIIEFPCSAALPVLFASILTESNVSFFVVFICILIYLLFYLLDEIIVFLISVFSMKILVVSPKFTTILNLIASIIMFFLGIYYFIGIV